MKKLFFLLFLLMVMALRIQAQQTIQQVITTTIHKMEKGVELKLSLQIFDANGSSLQQTEGKLSLLGKKFRLHYGQFDAAYNGKLFTYYDAEEKTFTRMTPSAEDIATINPFAYLSTSQKLYTIKEIEGTRGSRIVALTPKKKMGNIKHFEITLNRKTDMPQELMTLFSDGARMVTRVSNISFPKEIPHSLFEQKHADYPKSELIDLQ